MSSSNALFHKIFVYGSILEPAVAAVILDRTASTVPAILHGYHRYKLKGRPYPCIVPRESGKVLGKVITGVSDAELNNFDVIEGSQYERVTVEVERVEWRVNHADKFVETFKKILEWNKNPDGKPKDDVVESLLSGD